MIWVFVLTFFILYEVVPDRWKDAVFFLWSLVLCAFVSPFFLVIVIIYAGINFFSVLFFQTNERHLGRKKCFLGSVIVNSVIFILVSFLFGRGIGLPPAVQVMCGFIYLRMIFYHYGLYTGENRISRNPLELLLYAAFFPVLAAGPVLSHRECRMCLEDRRTSVGKSCRGVSMLFLGLLKILMLAVPARGAFMFIYNMGSGISVVSWIMGLFFCAFFLFYLAVGYLDMVRGVCLVLGMKMRKHVPDVVKGVGLAMGATLFWGWGFDLYPCVGKAAGYLGRLLGGGVADRQGMALLTGFLPLCLVLILFASPLPQIFGQGIGGNLAPVQRLKMRIIVTVCTAIYAAGSLGGNSFCRDINRKWAVALGEREYNRVIRGKDNYLFEKPEDYREDEMDIRAAAIGKFAKSLEDVPVFVMVCPDSSSINTDKIPPQTLIKDQEKDLDKMKALWGREITWIEVEGNLKDNRKETLFYRTAPYWNSRGAYYGYEALKTAMSLDSQREQPLREYIVSGDFHGELSERSGYQKGYREEMTLFLPEYPDRGIKTLVNFADSNKTSVSIYDSRKLGGDHGYDVYLGGGGGEVRILTTADSGERLLMIGDGYGSALVPFLVPHFREIIVIDPENYKGNVNEIARNERMTGVLFVYGCNHFLRENRIGKVMNGYASE